MVLLDAHKNGLPLPFRAFASLLSIHPFETPGHMVFHALHAGVLGYFLVFYLRQRYGLVS